MFSSPIDNIKEKDIIHGNPSSATTNYYYDDHDSLSIENLKNNVINGKQINFEEAKFLISNNDIVTLANCANEITRKFNGDTVDVDTLRTIVFL